MKQDADTTLLDLKIRFKCFFLLFIINHQFWKAEEKNPRFINDKVY